jgi:hypothetical protein
MSDGFTVNLAGIDAYSGTLTGDQDLVSEVGGLVGQSDVGDQSWGVVGLFVKSSYSTMLGDLTGLLDDMREGLRSGAEKMTATAADYRAVEQAIADIFNGGADALEGN